MHQNSGNCPGCEYLFNLYPNFHQPLKDWFKALQAKHPELHVSAAGRGRERQEKYFASGLSRAHYGNSAHNYNAAIDCFFQKDGKIIYDREPFNAMLAPALTAELEWYGSPGARFPELPHVQWRAWRELADAGILNLVEP